MDLSKFENNNGVYCKEGNMMSGDILRWIEDRLGNTVYEEFEF